MNKIIFLHYATIFSILGFAFAMNSNLILLMILFAIIFAACAVKFANVVHDRAVEEQDDRKKHRESHQRMKVRLDKFERALENKLDKPSDNVRPGTYVSEDYLKMLEEKGVTVSDDRTEDTEAS